MARGQRSYPGGLRCQIISIGILLALASLYHGFSTSYVQQNQVFTQSAAQGASFTALSASDVPFYNAGGFAPIDDATTQLYSFNWFVFASDALRPFLMVYTLVAVVLAVLVPLDTLSALLYQPIVTLVLLLELAKVVYFLLILFGVFGFSCASYAFCRNRNPAITATPDNSFIVALISAAFFVVVAIALTTLPSAVRKAHLSSDPIAAGARFADSKASPPVSEEDDDEEDAATAFAFAQAASPLRSNAATYRTGRQRRSKRLANTTESRLIHDFPLTTV